MNLFKLVGSVFINNNDANRSIDDMIGKAKDLSTKVGKSMQDTGSKMTDLGKKIAPVSLAFAGMMTASVKSASDFQNGMAKMSTLFDTTKTSVDDLSKQFLDLSNKTGISATELAEAGYQALSAGVDVRDSAKFVETAGKLAKAGFTSTTTSVDVLTTAMNAYGESAGTAEEIANKLVRTQNLGKTTVDELGSSMGKIIPTASGMNVSIDNLMAGYVSLTKQGIATAEATTYMNSMLNELGDSGTTVGKILKDKTGKSFQELMADGASMGDVLKILQDEADASGTNFNELWGSAEAGKASLALLNGGVDEFNATVETMASDTDDVGDALKKLETPSVKAKKALNQIKNSGIELGTAFLSAMLPAINGVAKGVEKVTGWFNKLPTGVKTVIASVMAFIAVLAPALIVGGKVISSVGKFIEYAPKIVSAVKTAMTAVRGFFAILMANPIGLVIAGIIALIAIFVVLWKRSEKFRNFWKSLWNTVKKVVTTALTATKKIITTLVKAYVKVIKTEFNLIKKVVTTVVKSIKSVVSKGFNAVKSAMTKPIKSAKTTVVSVFNSIKSGISKAMNGAKTAVSNAIKAMKSKMKFSWSLPKLKLPHIKITGKWGLNPPSYPKFSVSWYRKAMQTPYMFTQPTVFNTPSGLKGAGEAGDEIMYGRQNLMNDIREASGTVYLAEAFEEWMEKMFRLCLQYFPQFGNQQIVMDTGAMVGQLAPKIDKEFGRTIMHKGRGNK